jgi:hypothetical protein
MTSTEDVKMSEENFQEAKRKTLKRKMAVDVRKFICLN